MRTIAELVGNLKPLQSEQVLRPSTVMQAPRPAGVPANDFERAQRYLAGVPGSSEGGRNNALNGVAYRLLERFDLQEHQHAELCRDFGARCSPPLQERECQQVARSAWTAAGRKGANCSKRTEPIRPAARPQPAPAVVPKTRVPLSVAIRQQVQAEKDGTRYTAKLPWPLLSHYTKALRPGTVTIISAPKGKGKSFFLGQMGRTWMESGERFRILELEDDRLFHARRYLGQMIQRPEVGDIEWVNKNKDDADYVFEKYAPWLDEFGEHLDDKNDLDGKVDAEGLVKWVKKHAPTNRILAIDPITAKDPSSKVWLDDHRIVVDSADVAVEYGTSLVFITHPSKGKEGEKVAGGAAYDRLTQTVIHIDSPDTSDGPPTVKTPKGDIIVGAKCNRGAFIDKARNSSGAGLTIAFNFDETLTFRETGLLDRKK